MNKILSPSEVDALMTSLSAGKPLPYSALSFAGKAHLGQVRKFTGYPYITHCFEVMCILEEHGVYDGDVLCSGLLHDTIEDTPVTHANISSCFGERVADIVVEVTNPSKDKDTIISHLASASPEGKMVKLADIISNTMNVALLDRRWAYSYLMEKKKVLRVLEMDHPLYNTAVLTVQRSFGFLKGVNNE